LTQLITDVGYFVLYQDQFQQILPGYWHEQTFGQVRTDVILLLVSFIFKLVDLFDQFIDFNPVIEVGGFDQVRKQGHGIISRFDVFL